MTDLASSCSIRVNGKDEPLAANVAALLEAKDIPRDMRGVAVARNGEVVPRAQWSETALAAGDTIEIVIAKQGG